MTRPLHKTDQGRRPPPARATVARAHAANVTYQCELVKCGKARCKRCAAGPAHGPYWYAYFRGGGGRVVSKYVGKVLPDALAGLAVDVDAD